DVVREVDGSEWVTFAGHLSDAELVALYRSAWVAASASSREGWGMSLTEAAACGTPSVVTRIPGHVDAVVDGVSGVLVARDDISAFASSLVRVLTDEELRAHLAAGALAHAARFTWEATAAGVMR